MQVMLVAISRRAENERVTAIKEIPELPEEGEEFQVADLGYCVSIHRVVRGDGILEVHFHVRDGGETGRLRRCRSWHNPNRVGKRLSAW